MQALEVTVTDNDILGCSPVIPSVVIASALNGYVIVTIVKVDILNEDISRAFGIYAVIVDKFGIVAYASADDILAVKEMETPERRVGDKDVLNGNTFTPIELN